jgi:uncharacterized membrane protein
MEEVKLNRLNKAPLGAIIGGILGIFFATVGFWCTLLILFLIVLGWLIGSYFEAKKK